jgi:hypothetical protein
MSSQPVDGFASSTVHDDWHVQPTLKKAFPHMINYESAKTITQANAEGQRLVLTLHEDETPDHKPQPYDHEVFLKRALSVIISAPKRIGRIFAALCFTCAPKFAFTKKLHLF